jgi:DNA-binding transcriptional LysR family regulator
MTLHQLKIFDAVARNLSFTKAAGELRISQPSVFQQIKALEVSCGKTLYTKRGRGIALTPVGREFGAETRKIIEGMRLLESHYGDPSLHNFLEPLVVGGCHALSAWVLPTLIAKYKHKNPNAQISLRTKSSPVIERLVLESEVDIALVTNPPSSSLLRVEPYRDETMVFVVSQHHALANNRHLSLIELAQGPLIIRERKKSLSRKLLDQLELQGYQPNILMICDSAYAVKNAVLAGLGIGIIYRDHVRHEIKNGALGTVKVHGLKKVHIQSFIIYRADKMFTRSTQDFYNLLKDSHNEEHAPSSTNATSDRLVL